MNNTEYKLMVKKLLFFFYLILKAWFSIVPEAIKFILKPQVRIAFLFGSWVSIFYPETL